MFDVIGFVKSGADINTLSSSAVSVVNSLTHNDVIIFSGGTKILGKIILKKD
jgi:quinolinate synthase